MNFTFGALFFHSGLAVSGLLAFRAVQGVSAGLAEVVAVGLGIPMTFPDDAVRTTETGAIIRDFSCNAPHLSAHYVFLPPSPCRSCSNKFNHVSKCTFSFVRHLQITRKIFQTHLQIPRTLFSVKNRTKRLKMLIISKL